MSAKGVHTSGPWKVYHELLRPQFPGRKIIEIQTDHGHAVVQWSGFDNSDRLQKTHLANARLMAAAPDLYRAAQRALECLSASYSQPQDATAIIADLKAAIARVEGRR